MNLNSTTKIATPRAIFRNKQKDMLAEFRKLIGWSNKKMLKEMCKYSGYPKMRGITQRVLFMKDMAEAMTKEVGVVNG